MKIPGRGFHNVDNYVGDVWWEGQGDDLELMARLWAGPTGAVYRGSIGGTAIASIRKDIPDYHAWVARAVLSGEVHRQGRAGDLGDAQDQVLDALDEIIPGIRGLLVQAPPTRTR